MELEIALEGEGAQAHLSGVSVLDGKRHSDVTTHIVHASGNTDSTQIFKHVAGGQGRAVYQGKVTVAKGANGSDSNQSAKALLLGFPFLTQGIVTGSVWAKYTYGSYLHWSLTSLPLLLAWFMYALLLGGRRTLGWQGIKAARATVGGFIVVLASYFVHTL